MSFHVSEPAANLLYYGTGDAFPSFDPQFRPGDNLFTASTIALDADTGKITWYFQETPNEHWDFDTPSPKMLYDVDVNGEKRKVVANFSRNGYYYTLDRNNGQFLRADQYQEKITWTKGIDPKTGKPVEYDASKPLQVYANGTMRRGGETVNTCPNIQGGMNFWPPAVDSTSNIAYGAGIEGCSDLTVEEKAPEDVAPGATTFAGGAAAASGAQTGAIFAFDVTTGKQVAKIDRPYPNYAGVMTTPGLVWTGEMDGTFGAYDAKTLEQKWSINVGGTFSAPPIAFKVGDKEYVAIAAGGSAVTTLGYPELANRPAANVLYVFAL